MIETEINGITYKHISTEPVMLTSRSAYDPESMVQRPAMNAGDPKVKEEHKGAFTYPNYVNVDWNGYNMLY